jgi:hypothetical protein
MQFAKISRALACVAVLGVFSAVASADATDKKTIMKLTKGWRFPAQL